jgi:NAD(P)-dependent dehydrogenase (short-subunit alcohol dehydrogenase family)
VGGLDWGLAGKSIVVTGASSGIGAQISRKLGQVGASVAMVGRDGERLKGEVAEVERRGGRPQPIFAELEDPESAERIVAEAVEAFGPIHGVVHCASLFDPRPLADTTLESFERQMRVNVAVPLMMTRAAVSHLAEGSSIVFFASTIALVGFPGCSAYTATKGATTAITRALAVELAPQKIRVNVVAPGYVRTPMLQPHLDNIDGYEQWIIERTLEGRIAGPEELANNVLFLLSDLSAYVDGATLVADGGWVAQ